MNRLVHITLVLPLFVITACAALSGSREHYAVCSYDTVWEATVETMKGYSVTSQNKSNGTIETAWIEVEGKKRSFGIFGREGFGNLERARMTVSVKQIDDVSSVRVLENRQRWHARGGATQQAMKWWPVDPSEEVLQDVSDQLNAKLLEKGCHAS